MGHAISGFFTKLFSTDSIVSRIVRSLLLALMGGSTGGAEVPGGFSLPAWAIALIGIIVGMIPAGQNQSSPTTTTAKKAVPPTS